MADIEYIVNVATGADFAGRVPAWHAQITGAPGDAFDECIVRSIAYNSTNADTSVYAVWCSLKNSFIGSFPGGMASSISPGTRIKMNTPIPGQLQFRLYVPNDFGDPPIHVDVPVTGHIMIHLDFIKYKRPAGH